MKDYNIVGYVTIGMLMLIAGVVTGMTLVGVQQPSYYANGYCAALGGERLTDETCNIDGAVVAVE